MNKKILLPLLFISFIACTAADAQVVVYPRVYGGYGYGRMMRPRPGPRQQPRTYSQLPKFKPTLNLSLGYGFPNLDNTYLTDYTHAYKDGHSQTGPFTGSLDYRFSRTMSIGVLVTHGTVSAPYYNYGGSGTAPAFTAKLDNWAFMLNLMQYMPVSPHVTPYFRAAIGGNSWQQTYTEPGGNKAPVVPADLPDIAYQLGLGVKLNFTKHAGFFAEAGYGKYVLQGGLTFTL